MCALHTTVYRGYQAEQHVCVCCVHMSYVCIHVRVYECEREGGGERVHLCVDVYICVCVYFACMVRISFTLLPLGNKYMYMFSSISRAIQITSMQTL